MLDEYVPIWLQVLLALLLCVLAVAFPGSSPGTATSARATQAAAVAAGPVARIEATVSRTSIPGLYIVELSATSSSSGDGGNLRYVWDLDGDSRFEEEGPTVSIVVNEPPTGEIYTHYEYKLKVVGRWHTDTETATVYVGRALLTVTDSYSKTSISTDRWIAVTEALRSSLPSHVSSQAPAVVTTQAPRETVPLPVEDAKPAQAAGSSPLADSESKADWSLVSSTEDAGSMEASIDAEIRKHLTEYFSEEAVNLITDNVRVNLSSTAVARLAAKDSISDCIGAITAELEEASRWSAKVYPEDEQWPGEWLPSWEDKVRAGLVTAAEYCTYRDLKRARGVFEGEPFSPVVNGGFPPERFEQVRGRVLPKWVTEDARRETYEGPYRYDRWKSWLFRQESTALIRARGRTRELFPDLEVEVHDSNCASVRLSSPANYERQVLAKRLTCLSPVLDRISEAASASGATVAIVNRENWEAPSGPSPYNFEYGLFILMGWESTNRAESGFQRFAGELQLHPVGRQRPMLGLSLEEAVFPNRVGIDSCSDAPGYALVLRAGSYVVIFTHDNLWTPSALHNYEGYIKSLSQR